MSQPMTLKQITDAFDKWGVPYKIIGDPTRHRRDPGHGDWGPINGSMVHHTGDDAPDTADSRVISNGRSDLPGPLAQFGVRDDGVVEIHSIGRANHAGGGDGRVLGEVIAESYGARPSHTTKHEGEPGAVDGNARFYGWECYYSGGHKMTEKQYTSIVHGNAALLDHYNWSEKSVIGHKEWSDYKIDPAPYDMADIRTDIRIALKDGPKAARSTRVSKPVSKTPNITAAIRANIAYRKKLAAINNNAKVDAAVAQLIGEAKQQHRYLSEHERK